MAVSSPVWLIYIIVIIIIIIMVAVYKVLFIGLVSLIYAHSMLVGWGVTVTRKVGLGTWTIRGWRRM